MGVSAVFRAELVHGEMERVKLFSSIILQLLIVCIYNVVYASL
jgi:hypothetical protein